MTTAAADISTAVLRRSASAPGLLRRLQHRLVGEGGPLVGRSLRSSALLGATGALVAAGVLPVAHDGLVVAGLGLAALAAVVARAIHTPVVPAVLVPVGQLGAVALLYAGTASAAVLLLVLGPVLALSAGPGRTGVLAAASGSAAVLGAPVLLTSTAVVPAGFAGALLLAPLAVGLGGLAVHGTTSRLAVQASTIARLEAERAALAAQVRTRADELDLATRMLAARAQTMTSVIDAVTEQSIIGTDRDGVIRVWNPGAEKMLGLPRVDVVRQRSIVEFHVPEELRSVADDVGTAPGLAALVHAAQERGSDVRDWTYLAADGRQRTVSVAVTPRTDDRGVHAGWNFVGTDMTEARANEKMKDQFVSLISHELRTPLSSILGYLELVLDDEDRTLSEDQRKYLTTVERNAHRLLRLVGDLLFTAQVDAGRFTLQPEDVDLAAVVRAAEETIRVTADAAGVDVAVETSADGLIVPGDAVRLGQACDNLVSNAVKFTPSGGRVTLALRAAWQTADGVVTTAERPGAAPVAQLSVSDTGMGIPTGEQGRLFTRFFRASTAQRNAVPGVGLGLTITKAITTAHGGTLDVVSAEGAGTTFTLTLPTK